MATLPTLRLALSKPYLEFLVTNLGSGSPSPNISTEVWRAEAFAVGLIARGIFPVIGLKLQFLIILLANNFNNCTKYPVLNKVANTL